MATNDGTGSSIRPSTRTPRSTTNHADEAPESPRRRRTRPTQSATTNTSNSMTTTTTWSAVKQDFIQTVSGAVAELMQEHGYSRERATGAVLREISHDKSKTPQDIEVGCAYVALHVVFVELFPLSHVHLS
jgi:hypothetical protein